MKNKEKISDGPKKKFYQRKWFWIVVVILLLCLLFGGGDTTTNETTETLSKTITLTAGEVGDYGKEIVMNEDTDFEENLIVYYIPAGDYTVKNIGEFRTQVNVYEGFSRNEETGYDDYTNVGDIVVLETNETASINIPEGWFIEIPEPTIIELTIE